MDEEGSDGSLKQRLALPYQSKAIFISHRNFNPLLRFAYLLIAEGG